MIDSIRDSNQIQINSYNFGLLPINEKFGDKTIYELQSTATNDAQLIIKKCAAITLAGYRIELFDHKVNIRNLAKNMSQNQEEVDGEFYILASVNPFDHVSFGDIDADESRQDILSKNPITEQNQSMFQF